METFTFHDEIKDQIRFLKIIFDPYCLFTLSHCSLESLKNQTLFREAEIVAILTLISH